MASEKGGQISGHENRSSDEEVTDRDLGRIAASESQAEWSEDAKEEIDSLLDEMDGVLEENAEEFISAYKQKGGQ